MTLKKTIYILSGETSGDLHASNLISELPQSKYRFVGMAGKISKKVGMEITIPFIDGGLIGFASVIKNYRKLRALVNLLKKDIQQQQPDLLVCIDFGGLNLKMACFAHQCSIPVFYYIPPKVWAWKKNRIEQIKRYTTAVGCIFPFESELYERHRIRNYPVQNPSLLEMNQKPLYSFCIQSKTILLLPGSRKSEIQSLVPIYERLIDAVHSKNPDVVFIVIETNRTLFPQGAFSNQSVQWKKRSSINTPIKAQFAVCASGTATLELAICLMPHCAVYALSFFQQILKLLLFRNQFISLTNIIANEKIIEEMIHLPKKLQKTLIDQVQKLQPEALVELNSRLKKVPQNLSKNRLRIGKCIEKELKRIAE